MELTGRFMNLEARLRDVSKCPSRLRSSQIGRANLSA